MTAQTTAVRKDAEKPPAEVAMTAQTAAARKDAEKLPVEVAMTPQTSEQPKKLEEKQEESEEKKSEKISMKTVEEKEAEDEVRVAEEKQKPDVEEKSDTEEKPDVEEKHAVEEEAPPTLEEIEEQKEMRVEEKKDEPKIFTKDDVLKALQGKLFDKSSCCCEALQQEKLNTIAEVAESSSSEGAQTKTKDLEIPVTRMERGSSPIKIPKEPKLREILSTPRRFSSVSQIPSGIGSKKESDVDATESSVVESNLLEDKPESDDFLVETAMNEGCISTSAERSNEKFEQPITEQTPRVASDKSARLSVHIMPPVNIRRSLVMQKTLNLSIKPCGNVTNEMENDQTNVSYEEVKKSKEEQPAFRCPHECKNRDTGGLCKVKTFEVPPAEQTPGDVNGKFPISAHDSTFSRQDSKSKKILLDKDALLLYKSFQILNDAEYKALDNANKQTDSSQVLSRCKYSLREPLKITSSHVLKFSKSPFETGFYKSKSVQCRESDFMGKRPSKVRYDKPVKECLKKEKPSEPVVHLKTSHDDRASKELKKVSSAERSETENEPIVTQYEKMMNIKSAGDKSSRSSYSDASVDTAPTTLRSNTSHTSPKSSLEGSEKDTRQLSRTAFHIAKNTELASSSDADDRKEEPIGKISMDKILYALQEDKSKVKEESEDKKSEVSSDVSESVQPSESVRTEDEEKGKSKTSSTTSSSGSSFNIRGSVTSPRDEAVAKKQLSAQQTGIKRPYAIDTIDQKSSHSSQSSRGNLLPGTPIMEMITVKEPDFDDRKESKKKSKDSKTEIEPEVSKDVKPHKKKIDENIQVSMGPSTESEESTDSFDAERDRANTIACFIKGLTGTSQEELKKIRSNPSFPKTDLASWSKSILKTGHSPPRSPPHKKQLPRAPSKDVEVIVDSVDYGRIRTSEMKSFDSFASDRNKTNTLKEYQKLSSAVNEKFEGQEGDKKEKENIVMRISEDKGNSGEGDDQTDELSKRELPFYRRVLGRIIEPSTRKPMQKSLSDPNPMEESISEGEVKSKSTHSIGEVSPFKFLERKRAGKSGVKYLKKHLDEMSRKEMMGDSKSLKLSRQRAQYNNWVAYYLQKHHNMTNVDDSSSTSPSSSTKK